MFRYCTNAFAASTTFPAWEAHPVGANAPAADPATADVRFRYPEGRWLARVLTATRPGTTKACSATPPSRPWAAMTFHDPTCLWPPRDAQTASSGSK